MADLLSTSIAGTLNVSQGATISSNLFVSNTDIVPEITKYARTLTNVNYDHVKSWYPTNQLIDLGAATGAATFSPSGVFVKPDGTQLYVLENTNDNVYQFRMTTAHNVASAIYEGNLRISSADTTPSDLFFSNTGTILYILGDGGNAIDAYDLPTAWNVVAGTTGANNIVAGNTLALYTATWEGMYMSPNGAFLYLSTDPTTSNSHIVQYNVATPWNVATSTLSSAFNVEPFGITSPSAVGMNKTGTKMYVIENGANYDIYVNEFNLSQPFQLATASYSGRSQLWSMFNDSGNTPEVDPYGFFYDTDSNTAYVVGTGDDYVRTAKTVSGAYIQNSIVVDGKITANNGLDVAGASATTLGGGLYVSGTTILYSGITITGGVTLTGGTLSFSGTNYTFGTSTSNSIYDIGTGATIATRVKSIRIGTGGVASSNTDILIGTNSGGNSNIAMFGNTVLINNRDILPAIDSAANTVRVSQNSTSTLSAKQLNFVNTANATITVSDSGDGNANVEIFVIGGTGGSGAQGVQGAPGAQGAVGAQGVQGAVGAQGADGAQGVQGAIGAQGAVGAQGVQGAIGAQGAVGAQGVQGEPGTGAQGAQGAPGTGAQGVQGSPGSPGAQGVQGSPGSPGAQGVQGSPGAQGVQGATGLSNFPVSANSGSTVTATAINFVNTSTTTVTVTSGISGNANVAVSVVKSAIIFVGTTAPSSPAIGDLWVDTN